MCSGFPQIRLLSDAREIRYNQPLKDLPSPYPPASSPQHAMSLVAEERILVVPTSLFHSLGHFQGFSREIDRYWPRIVEGEHVEYRPRSEMEADPSFKQFIPYCLFRWVDANGMVHFFEYQRGGGSGEARLRAKCSVGIGGHISSIDAEVGHVHDV